MAFDYRQIDPTYTPARPMAVVGKVAIVPMSGVHYFEEPAVGEMFGFKTTGRFCATLMSAAAMEAVDAVVLDVCCPGGSGFGIGDIQHAFASLKAAGKKVYAIAHDMAASLAMLPMALADEAIATPTAMLGCMGSRNGAPHWDISEPLKRDGVKTFLGAFPAGKAQGVDPGLPLSDAAKAAEMEAIKSIAMPYLTAIANGRGISVESVIALDAMPVTPSAAVKAGLIDAIETFPAFLARVLTTHNGSAPSAITLESGTMSKETPTPSQNPGQTPPTAPILENKAATFEELSANFGKDPAFIVGCLEKKYTLAQAKDLHAENARAQTEAALKSLTAKVEELTAANAALTTELAEAKTKKVAGVAGVAASAPGAAPVNDANPTTFEMAAQSCMAAAKNNKAQAILAASRKFPHLASEYMLAGEPVLNLREV